MPYAAWPNPSRRRHWLHRRPSFASARVPCPRFAGLGGAPPPSHSNFLRGCCSLQGALTLAQVREGEGQPRPRPLTLNRTQVCGVWHQTKRNCVGPTDVYVSRVFGTYSLRPKKNAILRFKKIPKKMQVDTLRTLRVHMNYMPKANTYITTTMT